MLQKLSEDTRAPLALSTLLLALLLATVPTAGAPRHAVDENPPPGLNGPQRKGLIEAIAKWPSRLLPPSAPESHVSVKLVAYNTPDHPHAIGVGQAMLVEAPITEVKKVLEDFDHYKQLFFEFKDIHVVEREGNRVTMFWEQPIPLPFVPNTTYTTYFYTFDSDPTHIFYRYQLKSSNTLKYSDGIMVLDRIDSKTTRYTEYDFFDADWGIAASLAPARIWRDSLRDIFLTDIAIKLKAEHPDWSYDKIRQECKKHWEDEYNDDSVGDIINDKKVF
ncbi:MAG: hypothetical protein HY074_11020 [Deltaproteobacteria bacterium]|nr:hypothetical protein [Deltaproteobacteria bacterium]